jgi:plasmid stability protein
MRSITIRGIDEDLDAALRRMAKRSASSVNATVLRLLRQSLGEGKRRFRPCHHDLDHLAGTWTEQERQSFDEAVSDFASVDQELWR